MGFKILIPGFPRHSMALGRSHLCVSYRHLVVVFCLTVAFTWLLLLLLGMFMEALSCDGRDICCTSPSLCDGEISIPQTDRHLPNRGEWINRGTLGVNVPVKQILLWTKKRWVLPQGQDFFQNLGCSVTQCSVTSDRAMVEESSAVIVDMSNPPDPQTIRRYRNPQQRWIFLTVDSPMHSKLNLDKYNGLFNWTATYTTDADITVPFATFKLHDYNHVNGYKVKNIAAGKTRMVAWFVDSCKPDNVGQNYIKLLQKHVRIDTYGPCAEHHCKDPQVCFKMLSQSYRFYIAFENSQCQDYVTQEFWVKALLHDVVPIVMGPSRKNYQQVAPPNSFIHVNDFQSPKALARRLRILSRDDSSYNKYFQWRQEGSIQVKTATLPLHQQFWCSLCSKLHTDRTPQVHSALSKWWSVEEQCDS